jgi:hypothetical protein
MPHGGATFDEKRLPLDKGGLQGGFGRGNKPTPLRAAVAVVRSVADEHTLTTPAVTVGPGIPSSTEEGSLFSRDREPKPASDSSNLRPAGREDRGSFWQTR